MERDFDIHCTACLIGISTHTLTWSVTEELEQAIKEASISTHTLTWSVTYRRNTYDGRRKDFNSHAHVERDVHD